MTSIHEESIRYGLQGGQLRHVSEVPNGLPCDCVCPDCREPLMAKKGPVLAHHFAHVADSNCNPSPETLTHRYAKELIASRLAAIEPAFETRQEVRETSVWWRQPAGVFKADRAIVEPTEYEEFKPVQLAFFWVAEKIWPNGSLWEFPVLAKAIKKGIQCFLVAHLFDKQSASYLSDAPARIVVRDLAKANLAAALENCLARDFWSLGFLDAEIQPRRYETTWRVDGEVFTLTPAISHTMFQKLSDAATVQCERKVSP